MISVAELGAMRETLEASLPDLCVVTTDTRVSDGAGGYTTTPSSAAPVACRIAPSTGREATIAGRLDAVGTWTLTLPAETPVAAPNRVYSSSREFEVVLPLAPRSWEISRRVVCLEVQ